MKFCKMHEYPASRFYGVAWYDYKRDLTYYTYWPFNILLGILRLFWFKIRYYRHRDWLNDQLWNVRSESWRDGYNVGFKDGQREPKQPGERG